MTLASGIEAKLLRTHAISGLKKAHQLVNITTVLTMLQCELTARRNVGAREQCLPVLINLRETHTSRLALLF